MQTSMLTGNTEMPHQLLAMLLFSQFIAHTRVSHIFLHCELSGESTEQQKGRYFSHHNHFGFINAGLMNVWGVKAERHDTHG